MKRVRVTELECWQQCAWKWYYRYVLKLERPPLSMMENSSPLVTGLATHFGIEAGLLGQDAVESAWLKIDTELGERGKRFKPGVEKAINAVPAYVWERERPQVEGQIDIQYGEGEGAVTISGKPDVWFMDDGGVEIIDFKTTSKKPSEVIASYEMWNQQIRYYAVLINDWLWMKGATQKPVYTKHIALTTKGDCVEGKPKMLSRKQIKLHREHMVKIAQSVPSQDVKLSDLQPAFSSRPVHCGSCEYQMIDELYLTHGDHESAIGKWPKT